MSARTHHLAGVPGLTLCALAASSVLAFAQDPTTDKNHHAEDPNSTAGVPSSNGPPSTSHLGRFLLGDGAPDIDQRDQDNVRYHLADERRTKPQLVVFARTPNDVRSIDVVEKELLDLGVGLISLAPFRRDRIGTPGARLLTDGASINARNYGVFDPVTSNPRPAVFLVDRNGKIQMMMSGGIPADGELVRLTREALEKSGELVAQPPPALN